jgi:hypothetical protein
MKVVGSKRDGSCVVGSRTYPMRGELRVRYWCCLQFPDAVRPGTEPVGAGGESNLKKARLVALPNMVCHSRTRRGGCSMQDQTPSTVESIPHAITFNTLCHIRAFSSAAYFYEQWPKFS